MRRAFGVVMLVLLTTLAAAVGAGAQQDPTRPPARQTGDFLLEQNYPNPFRSGTVTHIPFVLGETLFTEGRAAVVSLRIFNIVQQFVAAPTAEADAGAGAILARQFLQPGRFEASWDGLDQSGRPVPAGVYWVQIEVNGKIQSKKLYVQK
jgi:hypothetical protein